MAGVVVGTALRGSALRVASGPIGVGVKNFAVGIAATVAAVLGVKQRLDSHEDLIIGSELVTATLEDTFLVESAATLDSRALLDEIEAPNAPLPVEGDPQVHATGLGVSSETIWNLARLAVDVTRLGVDLYKYSTPHETQSTAHSVYRRGRTLAETHVQAAAHPEAPGPQNDEGPEEDQKNVTQERFRKGNKLIEVPAEERRGQSDLTNEVHKLLLNEGKKIYNTMRDKAKADFGSGSTHTIWSDKNWDYRFDAGYLNRANGRRNVMFQVNSKPASGRAMNLLRQNKKRGTHKQMFGFEFDTNNFPSFDEWWKIVLEASRNPL